MAIGYTQFDTPLLQAARLSGVTSVSLLVLSINAGPAYALLEPRGPVRHPLARPVP